MLTGETMRTFAIGDIHENRWFYRLRVYYFMFGYYMMVVSGMMKDDGLLMQGFVLFVVTATMIGSSGD